MLNLINQIVARAKANRQRIVLPEGTEERTLKAANMILTDEVADLILLGKPAEINELALYEPRTFKKVNTSFLIGNSSVRIAERPTDG